MALCICTFNVSAFIQVPDDDDDDDDDDDNPMILNYRAKNYTSERTIVPWTVIFYDIVLDFIFDRL